jgi:hypothetical protein
VNLTIGRKQPQPQPQETHDEDRVLQVREDPDLRADPADQQQLEEESQ